MLVDIALTWLWSALARMLGYLEDLPLNVAPYLADFVDAMFEGADLIGPLGVFFPFGVASVMITGLLAWVPAIVGGLVVRLILEWARGK